MAASPTTFTFELDAAQQEKLLAVLAVGNYRPRNVPYALAAVVGDGFNCALYEKEKRGRRKLCVQGAQAQEFVEFVLEPQAIVPLAGAVAAAAPGANDAAHAGSDESGKGDYFGPLVVACCYVEDALAKPLRELTVKTAETGRPVAAVQDCKKMSKANVLAAARRIREFLGTDRYEILKIGNPAYNRMFARLHSVTRILAWAHATCIENLLTKQPGCRKVALDMFARVPMAGADGGAVLDEWGKAKEDVARSEAVMKRALKERGKRVELVQQHRAEEAYLGVAAASVLARAAFLEALCQMAPDIDAQAEIPLGVVPIGSSDPRVRSVAEEMVRRHGPTWLMNHCKAHFQTTDKVLAACGLSRTDLPPEGQVVGAGAGGGFYGRKKGEEKK